MISNVNRSSNYNSKIFYSYILDQLTLDIDKMYLLTILEIILFILIIIAILRLFFGSQIYEQILKTIINQKTSITNYSNDLQIAKLDAIKNINRVVEESFINGTDNIKEDIEIDIDKSENIISYINRPNRIKLELYYKPSCPYCKDFIPTWTKIINELPNDATYEEINCEEKSEKANQNKITSVPSIILLVDNEKKNYMGNKSYDDITHFLKINGINLIKRTFEDFNSLLNTNTSNTNPYCPAVTFDKTIDIANDQYMFQIFNANGQYGYATGGYYDKLLSPFQAAYSVVDSYLSSLPDNKDPTKSSYKNINECAKLYNSQIVNFGLCDTEQLNAINNFQTSVSNGNSSAYIDGTNYSNNNKIIDSIKLACGFNS